MLELTKITATSPSVITKQYSLGGEGVLVPKPGGVVYQGNLERLSLLGLKELGEVISSLTPSQALIYGLPRQGVTKITTKRMALQSPLPDEEGTRTKSTFSWSTSHPGVMMIDYDPGPEEEVLGRDDLVALIRGGVPGLADVEMLWVPSASSMIYRTDTGEQIYGVRGQRLYIAVEDPVSIPDAGRVLFDRLWLGGHGRIELSANGSMLTRSPCDGSVWSPERLDFAGGSKCHAPLEQRRGDPVIIEGSEKTIHTQKVFLRLDSAEQTRLNHLRNAARKDKSGAAKSRRSQYVNENHRHMFTSDEADSYAALEDALRSTALTQNFLITLDGGEQVSVQQVLDNRTKYHNNLCLDPLEPGYQGGKTTGRLYLSGANPKLHSFAHGGSVYSLVRQKSIVEMSHSDAAMNRNSVLEVLRKEDTVFEYSGMVAVIAGDSLCILNNDNSAGYLNSFFIATKTLKKGESVPMQIPKDLIRDLVSLNGGTRALKPLKAIIHTPTMCPNGRMLEAPGYDGTTELFYAPSNLDPLAVPVEPTDKEVKDAVKTLLYPFREFPMGGSDDRAALLSALLTAVCRPVLDITPGFTFNSSVTGAGKTLLARCVAVLAEGKDPAVTTAPSDPEEWRKKIFASLTAARNVMFIDNVYGLLRSATLDAILTNGAYQDRVLGASKEVEVSVRSLWLITGNSMTLSEDLARRMITCNIHPEEDEVEVTKRRFDFNPVAEVRDSREEMVHAANTLLRASFCRKPKYVPLSSYEEWGQMVLGACAVASSVVGESIGDPRACVDAAREECMETSGTEELLNGIVSRFGVEVPFLGRELIEAGEADAAWSFASKGGATKENTEGAYHELDKILPEVCRVRDMKSVTGAVLKYKLKDRLKKWTGDHKLEREATRSKQGYRYFVVSRDG